MGILSLNPNDIDNYIGELSKFSDNEKLQEKWKNGVKLDKEMKTFTYFFLDEPLKLDVALKRTGEQKKEEERVGLRQRFPKIDAFLFRSLQKE